MKTIKMHLAFRGAAAPGQRGRAVRRHNAQLQCRARGVHQRQLGVHVLHVAAGRGSVDGPEGVVQQPVVLALLQVRIGDL